MFKKTDISFQHVQDHHRILIILSCNLMLWLVVVGAICLTLGPASAAERDLPEKASNQRIYMASLAVEEAWEEFHRSAIGGTLASPFIQTQIEQQLHESRALLMNARKAKRNGQHVTVKKITDRVRQLSSNIVMSSREKKQMKRWIVTLITIASCASWPNALFSAEPFLEKDTVEMVVIPAGSYIRGSGENEGRL